MLTNLLYFSAGAKACNKAFCSFSEIKMNRSSYISNKEKNLLIVILVTINLTEQPKLV